MAHQFDVAADTITADTNIVEGLGADSLDVVDMSRYPTVADVVSYIEENM